MLKLIIIEVHLLLVPEMSLLLQLRTPTMLLHSLWCEFVHLWQLIHILELHALIVTKIYLEVLLLFWEVISSL